MTATNLKDIELSVKNQSQSIGTIDIKVSIDNEVKVDRDFAYNVPQKFNIQLQEGKHHLLVSSEKGGAKLEDNFTVSNANYHFAGVDYFYGSYPDSQYFQPKHFSFSISQ